MKNILLLGGAGFIGSNIIRHILDAGDFCVSIIEPEFASLHRLSGLDVITHRCEVGNIDELKSIIIEDKIDTVIHLVSTIIPGSNFNDYQREFTNVIFPSIRLMELCCERNIRFVYFSSGGTVYGDRKGEIVPFAENCPMAPISYYGWSKQMMENSILFMHRTQNLQYLIIRPSNPFGKGQNLYGKQGFIAVALGRILEGKKIQVWGDGSAIRDYIYIDDLGKAVVDLLKKESIVNVTLNIGSSKGYSVNQIITFLQDIVKEDVGIEYLAARQADVSSVVLDTTQLRNLINFTPIDIREGINKFYHDVKNGN